MLTAVTTIIDVMKTINEVSSSDLGEIAKDTKRMRNNIISISRELMVEPMIIATKGAAQSQAFSDMNKVALKTFAAFYVQAFQNMVTVERIEPRDAIRVLNHRFSGMENDFSLHVSLGEDVELGLEDAGEDARIEFLPISDDAMRWNVGMEAKMELSREQPNRDDPDPRGVKTTSKWETKGEVKDIEQTLVMEVNLIASIDVNTSLVTETSGGSGSGKGKDGKGKDGPISLGNDAFSRTVSIPIIFKAVVFTVSNNTINTLVGTRAPEKGFWLRWNEWRSGGISLFNLLTGNDLVKEYKKNRIKGSKGDDDNSVFEELNTAKATSIARLLKDKRAAANLNNTVILTMAEAKQLEKIVRGKLDNKKVREKLFNSLSAIFLIILDDEWEKATMYIKEISGKTIITYRSVSKSKSSISELTELFKALNMGNTPAF